MHFIPKPIAAATVINDFVLAIQRAQKNIGFFHYQKGHDLFKVHTNEIIYLESLNREVRIAMAKGDDYFYGSLDEAAIKLAGYQFVLTYKCSD